MELIKVKKHLVNKAGPPNLYRKIQTFVYNTPPNKLNNFRTVLLSQTEKYTFGKKVFLRKV